MSDAPVPPVKPNVPINHVGEVPPPPPSSRRPGGREIAVASLVVLCLVTVITATLRLPPPDVVAFSAHPSTAQVPPRGIAADSESNLTAQASTRETTPPAPTSSPAVKIAKAPDAPSENASRTATIVLSGMPPGSELRIDGVIRSGKRLRIEPGRHVLTVTVDGRTAKTDTLTLGRDESLNWSPRIAVAIQTPGEPPSQKKPAPKATVPAATKGSRVSECDASIAAQSWSGALQACTKDANAGSASAKRQLALLYQLGRGVPRSDEQAATWFANAANAGDVEGAYQYALVLDRGRGAKKDQPSALRWYLKAAEGGHAAAQYAAGDAFDRGKLGAKKDKAQALHWFELAAAQNYRDAADKLRSLSK